MPQGLPEEQRSAYEEAIRDLERRPQGPQWGEGGPPKDGSEPPWKMVRGLGEGWTSEEIDADRPNQREWSVITLLVAEGNAVIRRERSRTPKVKSADLYVNGVKTEVKSLVKGGGDAIVKAVRRAAKQARSVVCDARASSLTKEDLITLRRRLTGMQAIRQNNLIDFVRIIGDNFDITWDFRQQTSSSESPSGKAQRR